MILLTLIALGMLLAEAHRISRAYDKSIPIDAIYTVKPQLLSISHNAPSKNGVKDDSPSLLFGAILVYLIVLC